jgi:hypothetical protein
MQISGNPRSKLLLGLAVLGRRVQTKNASFVGGVITTPVFEGMAVRLGVLSSLVPVSAEVSRALSRLGVFQDVTYVSAEISQVLSKSGILSALVPISAAAQGYSSKQGVFASTSLIEATSTGRKVSLSFGTLPNTLYITANVSGLPNKYAGFNDAVLIREEGFGSKTTWGAVTDTTLISGVIDKKWPYYNSCLVSATVLANTLSSDIQLESYLESRVVLCPKESC